MPRPTTFHPDAVLDRAMMLFWTQGYANTSIQDIVDSTEVLRGSLYHAFGDKRSLYIQTLQRYGRKAMQQLVASWEPSTPVLKNVRTVLMEIVELPSTEKRRGSLLCNAIIEVVPHDPQIATIIEGILHDFTAFFCAAFERGQQKGEISAQANVMALARYLVSSIQGLCVTAKAGTPREELLDIVEVTLAVWS